MVVRHRSWKEAGAISVHRHNWRKLIPCEVLPEASSVSEGGKQCCPRYLSASAAVQLLVAPTSDCKFSRVSGSNPGLAEAAGSFTTASVDQDLASGHRNSHLQYHSQKSLPLTYFLDHHDDDIPSTLPCTQYDTLESLPLWLDHGDVDGFAAGAQLCH